MAALAYPDTDGDGYWDGWLGVYGVGYSEDVILYREHLRDDDGSGAPSGIQGDEIVNEQIGIHQVGPSDPGATIQGPMDNDYEHSNVHLGELHWHSDPTEPNQEQLDEKTSLKVEVDYVIGHNPANMTLPNENTVLEQTTENYALYGVNLDISIDDRFTKSGLNTTCRVLDEPEIEFPGEIPDRFVDDGNGGITSTRSDNRPGDSPYGTACIQSDAFNVWETDLVEDAYHDDTSKLHLFWTTDYAPDTPAYMPHDVIGQIPNSVGGMEGHTGSPAQIAFIEGVWSTPHGAVMFDDNLGGPAHKHQILMEELGHGLGAGTADDHTLRIGECYSMGSRAG